MINKRYAVTDPEGATLYDLTFEQATKIFVPGSRLWESENEGQSYVEIFIE